MFSFYWRGRVTLWQASDKGGEWEWGHLCTSWSLWKTCDPLWPVVFCASSGPRRRRTGRLSVVDVLINVIVKRPRQRRLYSVSGVLELKKVSYLTDGIQSLWDTHTHTDKNQCEVQYVAGANLKLHQARFYGNTHLSLRIKSKTSFKNKQDHSCTWTRYFIPIPRVWGEVRSCCHVNKSEVFAQTETASFLTNEFKTL